MPMVLLNNILGGPGMNARLNLALREKTGYAYNVESHYSAFSNTGVFSVYFGTDRERLSKCRHLVQKEFTKLRNNPLSVLQIKRAKRQLTGQLTIGWENMENLMLAIGKSYMLFNRVDTMEDVHKKIGQITAGELLEVANIVLDPGQLSELVYH
jgi:predicted Zn-dependent peptidase